MPAAVLLLHPVITKVLPHSQTLCTVLGRIARFNAFTQCLSHAPCYASALSALLLQVKEIETLQTSFRISAWALITISLSLKCCACSQHLLPKLELGQTPAVISLGLKVPCGMAELVVFGTEVCHVHTIKSTLLSHSISPDEHVRHSVLLSLCPSILCPLTILHMCCSLSRATALLEAGTMRKTKSLCPSILCPLTILHMCCSLSRATALLEAGTMRKKRPA